MTFPASPGRAHLAEALRAALARIGRVVVGICFGILDPPGFSPSSPGFVPRGILLVGARRDEDGHDR